MKKLMLLALAGSLYGQDAVSVCHGADGNGGELGPPITNRLSSLTDPQLKTTILEGIPARGMPGNAVSDADMPQLLAKQFIKELTWASGIGGDGRPILKPDQEPSEGGTRVCPSHDGATNWYSPSYNPATGLFYMQTNEKCSIYTKRTEEFALGRSFLGGAQRVDPSRKPQRILRALDLQTGAVKWEIPDVGDANSWGGTIATSTGLVFFGEDSSGAFAAADATTGKTLWTFQTNVNWKASPMAYQFDGNEMIAVAAGSSIMAFGLAEE